MSFSLILSRLFFVLIMTLFCVPSFSFADDGDCVYDILSNTEEENWNYVFLLKEKLTDEQGSEKGSPKMWQRAVLGVTEKDFTVEEDAPIKVWGTALPGSEVQLYYWAAEENNETNEKGELKKPSIATCLLTTANESGIFSLEFNSTIFWRNIGKNLAVDAFFRTNISVAEQEEYDRLRSTASTGVMGHFFPLVLSVNAKGEIPEECEGHPDCSKNGMIRSLVLKKNDIPEVAQTTSGYFSNDMEVNRITDSHTFYAQFTDGTTNDADMLQKQTTKAFIMEILKRLLLANENAGGKTPGLTQLNKSELNRAIEGESVSDEVHDIAKNIRAALVSPNSTSTSSLSQNYSINAVSSESLSPLFQQIVLIWNSLIKDAKHQKTYFINSQNDPPPPPPPPPTLVYRNEAISSLKEVLDEVIAPETIDESLLEELFPQQKTDVETWQNGFLELLNFWTGKLDENHCLLNDDDDLGENFQNVNNIPPLCDMPYVSGSTPSLVLNKKEPILLHPEFHDAFLISADKNFLSETETWFFPEGEKETLHYLYWSSQKLVPQKEPSVCLATTDIPFFVDQLQKQLTLSPQEKEAVHHELSLALEEPSALYHISFADPKELRNTFSWWGNGKKLKIEQLFFHVEKEACSETNFSNISLSPLSSERDGFEVGIIP